MQEKERRIAPRFAFVATVAVVGKQSGVRIGRVKDLSRSGFYVAIPNPFPEHSRVFVTISTSTSALCCEGIVAHCTEGIGMGVTFGTMLPASKTVLEEWLDEAHSKQSDPEKSPERWRWVR